MIIDYLYEFHKAPKQIEEFKINTLKNYYYSEINKILKIKRENFQIGVNKDFNLLFFRDKTNKHNELVLNIYTNIYNFNFRKEISYSFNRIKSENFNKSEETKNINNSINYFNKNNFNKSNFKICNFRACTIL